MKRSAEEKKAARAAFAAMAPGEKLDHLWTYYKWPFLLGLAAVFIIVSSVRYLTAKKKPVLYTAYLNTVIGNDLEEELTGGFLQAEGIDASRSEVYVYRGLYLSEDASAETHETAYASRIKLLAAIENHQLDLVLMNQEAYDILSHNGFLMELDSFFQKDTDLERVAAPSLVSNEVIIEDNAIAYQLGEADSYEQETVSQRNALLLSSSPFIASANFDASVYLGVIANTERQDACLKYLHYLYFLCARPPR